MVDGPLPTAAVARPEAAGAGAAATHVLLVRHGQTLGNVSGERLYNPGLTDLGRVQARRLAEALAAAGVRSLLSSPLRRALETAAPVAARVGVPVEACNDLVEFNAWDAYRGASRAELGGWFPGARLEPAMPEQGWDYPGPEEAASAALRVRRILARVAALPPAGVVGIVAHGTFNGLLLRAWLGVAEGVVFAQANACINHLVLQGGTITVRALNETCHLDGL